MFLLETKQYWNSFVLGDEPLQNPERLRRVAPTQVASMIRSLPLAVL